MAQLTIEQAFQIALQHHQAGRLGQAEQVYRQILSRQPNHTDALHLLGIIAYQGGRNDIAVELIRRAIALRPNWPEAYSNLGEVLRNLGQLDEAVASFHRALALRPGYAEAHYNLGVVLKDKGEPDEAVASYRQAIALKSDYPEAHGNLAVALQENGQLDEAIACYRQAIALKPNYPQAYGNLGVALQAKGQLEEAIAACRRAIALKGDYPEAHCNLGNALRDTGELDEAIASYRRAIALKPGYPEAHYNLGNVLKESGRSIEAIASYRQAIALRPDYADAHSNLGYVLWQKGRLDEALIACRRAIALKPDSPEAYNNLGNALKDAGRLDEAIAAFRQAIAVAPSYRIGHDNLVYDIHFHPGYDGRSIARELGNWNRLHAEPHRAEHRAHGNDCRPDHRLRIGYVSPDFSGHPVGRFLLPLLAHHDRSTFEVFAYAFVPIPDAMTQRLRSHVDVWRNILKLSDAQAAELIRRDQIDILVDLTMHMANNRLPIFARKPAPVQVTWLAYCSTTGMDAIDYRLSDPYLDPIGGDESIYTEQTIRLPETYWCYQQTFATPEPGPLPALELGRVTFGCLNNFCKISEPTLAAWIRLLRAVPDSQLLLHAHEGSHRQRVIEWLEAEGIEPKRVQFAGFTPTGKYFELYRRLDIALDTFPYGGGTTTCDALWMGVPVVSLVGKRAVGRGGLSILSNIGLPELAARTEEDHVRLAIELAGDLPRLAGLRSTLRRRMEQSPLMDAPRFRRNIEAAYRRMWRTWCGRKC